MALLIGGYLAWRLLPAPWWVVAVVVLAGVEVAELTLWLRLRGRRPIAGPETLVAMSGRLTGPDRVRVKGTSYRARVLDGEPGDEVVVERVDGMTLIVRRTGAAR